MSFTLGESIKNNLNAEKVHGKRLLGRVRWLARLVVCFKCTKNLSSNLPVARHSLEPAIISAEGNVEPNDGLASLDQIEVLLLDSGHVRGLIVEKFDLLEEARLKVLIEFRAELGKYGHGANAYTRVNKMGKERVRKR